MKSLKIAKKKFDTTDFDKKKSKKIKILPFLRQNWFKFLPKLTEVKYYLAG